MKHGEGIWALGLMSGTSLDGVDAALVRTDGERCLETGPALTVAYDDHFRSRLRALMGTRPGENCIEIACVIEELTRGHAAAVNALLKNTDVRPSVIGFHGQTIFHAPDEGITTQIGDAALLAQLTGIPVVSDFRSADVKAGGEGAPLVPAWHAALAHDLPKPLAILNIGGVANVTWIGPDLEQAPLAFDTGPGNALLNDWMTRRCNEAFDAGGRLAATGRVDADRFAHLISHPFFQRPPPKSLDRNAFSTDVLEDLSDADGAATLTAFTIVSASLSAAWMPQAPSLWLVCGGGRENDLIMDGLRTALKVPVRRVDELGWDGDALEAQAFAFLAIRSLRGLPLSWPTTTGVKLPTCGGTLTPVK